MLTLDTLSDVQVLALTGYGEARGEPVTGLIAVMQVVMNRVADPRWPATVPGCCLQPWQFSCWNRNDPNRALLLVIAGALAEGRAMPGAARRPMAEALHVADGVMTRAYRDLVFGACHYHAQGVSPNWARGRKPITTIGHHLFYRGVP